MQTRLVLNLLCSPEHLILLPAQASAEIIGIHHHDKFYMGLGITPRAMSCWQALYQVSNSSSLKVNSFLMNKYLTERIPDLVSEILCQDLEMYSKS